MEELVLKNTLAMLLINTMAKVVGRYAMFVVFGKSPERTMQDVTEYY